MSKYFGIRLVEAEPAYKGGYEGYFVRYPDGFSSWVEKKAFDEEHREGTALPFGLALEALKIGFKVTRDGWNGKGMWLEVQRPDEHSKMTLPYIFLNYPADAVNTPGARVPWLASQTDMMSNDWSILE